MAFEAIELRYAYPKTGFAVQAGAIAIRPGECVALIGKNGSGKTTLGKLMGGLLRPDSGQVRLDGEDTADWPLGRIGRRVGTLFQEPSRQLFAPLVLEDLAFPLELMGRSRQQAEQQAMETLRRMELSHLAQQSTYTLSRGEQQRLAIGALLQNNPAYLILDEPTTGLDLRRRELLSGLLTDLLREGLGILLISHDSDFADGIATRSLQMEGGLLCDA